MKPTTINKYWDNFTQLFWILIIFDIGVRLFASINPTMWLFFFLDLGIKLFMVFHVGRYAYLISQKKHYVIFGLLGFIWIGFIGLAIPYFTIQSIKNRALRT